MLPEKLAFPKLLGCSPHIPVLTSPPHCPSDPHRLSALLPTVLVQTLQGVKWSATKWIHVGTFNKRLHSNGCEDRNERCEEWAGSGECTKNPSYMENNCPLACNRCKPKQKGQGGVAQRLGSKLGRKGVSST